METFKETLRKIWYILYPFLFYYAVMLIIMTIAQWAFGGDATHYVFCQLIATVFTIPSMLPFYRQGQALAGIAKQPFGISRERICHALGDALFYGGVWWSWVFPDAIFGILVGLFAKSFEIKAGGFNRKKVVLFNVVQVVANAIAWIVVAPVLDILIYAEPAKKVFSQGVFAFVANIIIVGVLGSLLGLGYTKIGAKSSSLTKED